MVVLKVVKDGGKVSKTWISFEIDISGVSGVYPGTFHLWQMQGVSLRMLQ